MEKKKVIIFYTLFGGGHLASARGLKEYIDEKYGNYVEVELVDGLSKVVPIFNKIATTFYNTVSKHFPNTWGMFYKNTDSNSSFIENGIRWILEKRSNKLYKSVLKNDYDYIISTHPFPTIMACYLKGKDKVNSNISTIVTDYMLHNFWYCNHENMQNIFVSTDEMKKVLEKEGVEENKIIISGIPISLKFSKKIEEEKIIETRKEFEIPDNKKVLAFFGGGELGLNGGGNIKLFKKIATELKENYHVVCISGKNNKLYNKYKEEIKNSKIENTTLIKYTTNVSNLLKISSGIFTKPGGLTITESIKIGVPIFMINPLPGQEIGNKDYIESIGAGVLVSSDNIGKIIRSIKEEDTYLEKFRQNANKINQINSSEEICKKLF